MSSLDPDTLDRYAGAAKNASQPLPMDASSVTPSSASNERDIASPAAVAVSTK